MKQFGIFTSPNGTVPDNAPEELTRPTAHAHNNMVQEMQRAITESGQTLTTLTNDDLTQLSKSINIHSLTGNVWDCTNVGNNYTLTRLRGDYDTNQALYENSSFEFVASANNTGAVNLTINGAGSLAISEPLLLNGSPLVANDLESGRYYQVIFANSTLNLIKKSASDITDFEEAVGDLFPSNFVGASGWRVSPDGLLEQWGRVTGTLDNNGQANLTFTLPMSYSNINYVPVATIEWDVFVSDAWGVTIYRISNSQVSVRADNVNGLTPKNMPINFFYQIKGML